MSKERVTIEGLSDRDKERVGALQELLGYVGRSEYVDAQERVAKRLGLSVRSVQRLMQRWRAEGLSGVIRKGRSDRGKSQLSEFWREYILETWREGNKDGRRLSRAQVYVHVPMRQSKVWRAIRVI